MTLFLSPKPKTTPDTACFSVTADTHPGTFPRVIELFAKRGLTPLKCHASQTHANQTLSKDTEQVIDIQMAGMDQDIARKIGASLRETWGVQSVLLSSKSIAR